MSVTQDIEKFKDVLNIISQKGYLSENNFLAPYVFSNEYLYELLGQLQLKDKSVLTTGSSGDQVLFSILHGAKVITSFDVNPFSKYVYGLKVAFIKTFDYTQLRNMFVSRYERGLWGYIYEEFAKIENYNLARNNLDVESRKFWDQAYKNGLTPKTNLWASSIMGIYRCAYLQDERVYNSLKQKLIDGNFKLNFITCDLRQLPQNLGRDNRYDVVLLSNILDYVEHWNYPLTRDCVEKGKLQFKKVVDKLAKYNLKDSGIMQVKYCWNGSELHARLDGIFDKKQISLVRFSNDAMIMYTPKLAKIHQLENENE